ncbi:DUF1311 domain-containing protein [Allofrancisella inopinata]|uniref:DUF1311 domain-containing protein n=2 Tax=Allofrancisella inopinata TaxID=1085647 RepID=A0AAE7CRB8_9GAMM|nr:DUF1311 domain-containing protein [Allofrancisella inopinata]
MKALIVASIVSLPIIVFSETNCNGNTYEINQCLKQKMQNLDKKLDKIGSHNIQQFKKYSYKICSTISSAYKGGSYEAIKYGNCIITLDEWYIEQLKK